jgi:murein DD-endopeptidase MepM/ murein hydrolase activator NlpD
MMRKMRFPESDGPGLRQPAPRPIAAQAAPRPILVMTVVMTALAGGCSADVGRFDFPGLGLNDKDGATASIPRPSMPMRTGGSSLIDKSPDTAAGETYTPPPGRDGSVRMAALPEPQNAPHTVTQDLPPSAPAASGRTSRPAAAPASAVASGGQTIEVQSGDTLYGLSKRHKVPVSELMSVNGLTGPALKPGQKLVLPAGGSRMKPGTRTRPDGDTTAAAAAGVGAAQVAPRIAAAPKAANWDGSYTVKPGDSLYAIARRHKVSQNELQQVNGIADPLKVRPGTVLKIPAEGGAAAVAAAPALPPRSEPAQVQAAAPRAETPVAEPPRVIQSTTQPTIINGEKKVAARTDTASDAVPAAAEKPAASETAAQPSKGEKSAAAGGTAVSGGKLRWPVKGKVTTGFGPRPDGTHNDGVNIAVPMGTEVHAAEGGVVAYAGSELKGYGNLILIRHDNGWVTAYAHNEELVVKRGDRVKRGQVVAKAGKSGQVDQPQLHFELRQGSKPVDPTPWMERM